MTPTSDLEIFARVVTAGNMSAAGREMGLSPAVVSKRISHLERRLGARLFQRTTRQLTLTDTGRGFYERIVTVLAGIEEAEAFVSRRNTSPQGRLRISAPTSFARMHIAPHLGSFLATYSDLKIELNLTDDFVDIVGEGYDLAIRIGELADSSLVARKLAPSRRVICAAPSYLKVHGIPSTLDDLLRHRCLSAGNQEIWRLEGPEGPVQLRVDSAIATNSSEVVSACVRTGLGIAMRSTWDIGPELESGALQIVLPSYHESSRVAVYAIYPSRRYMAAKLQVFIDFLIQLYGPREPYWDQGLDGTIPGYDLGGQGSLIKAVHG